MKTTGIKYLVLFFLAGSFYFVSAQTYTVDSVPNQKLINNSYVSNPDNIITQSAVDEINQKLSSLESQTTVQTAVVVINSIGDADIFNFAQQLFNQWGIGRSENNNGLLILLVYDQRTIRFHTGYGLEAILPDVMCKHIQMQNMLPSFREGNYDAGMMAGINEVVKVLTDPVYLEEVRADLKRSESGWNVFFWVMLVLGVLANVILVIVLKKSGSFSDSKKRPKNNQYPELRISSTEWLMIYGIIPIGGLLAFNVVMLDFEYPIPTFLLMVYAYFALALFYKYTRLSRVTDRLQKEKNYYEAVNFYQDRQVFWLVMGILIPLPFLFVFFNVLSRKRFFRNHPRDCKSCGNKLTKLSEKDDDQHLQKAQVFEEELGSVDYDVWLCGLCQSKETLNYVNRFSKYSSCPKCGTKALFKESRRTITEPTYTSTGTGEQRDRCKFCNHVKISTYTIAMKVESSSSSDSGSSGGSWGGGSSGGGGASSSW